MVEFQIPTVSSPSLITQALGGIATAVCLPPVAAMTAYLLGPTGR